MPTSGLSSQLIPERDSYYGVPPEVRRRVEFNIRRMWRMWWRGVMSHYGSAKSSSVVSSSSSSGSSAIPLECEDISNIIWLEFDFGDDVLGEPGPYEAYRVGSVPPLIWGRSGGVSNPPGPCYVRYWTAHVMCFVEDGKTYLRANLYIDGPPGEFVDFSGIAPLGSYPLDVTITLDRTSGNITYPCPLADVDKIQLTITE